MKFDHTQSDRIMTDLTCERLRETVVYYLKLPRSKVVLLQGIFETYEGVATVRTISLKDSIVCVMTTTSMKDVCELVLESTKDLLQWEVVEVARLGLNTEITAH